jgi:hypothetical protein
MTSAFDMAVTRAISAPKPEATPIGGSAPHMPGKMWPSATMRTMTSRTERTPSIGAQSHMSSGNASARARNLSRICSRSATVWSCHACVPPPWAAPAVGSTNSAPAIIHMQRFVIVDSPPVEDKRVRKPM